MIHNCSAILVVFHQLVAFKAYIAAHGMTRQCHIANKGAVQGGRPCDKVQVMSHIPK